MPRYVKVKERAYITETDINKFNKKIEEISDRMEKDGLQVDINSHLASSALMLCGGCRAHLHGVYTAEITGSEIISEWKEVK